MARVRAARPGPGVLPLLFLDLVTATLALTAAFILRYEGDLPSHFFRTMAIFSPIAVLTLWALGLRWHLYGSIKRYTSLEDMVRIAGAVAGAAIVLIVATLVHHQLYGTRPVPLSVPFIWAPLVFLGLGVSRLSTRLRPLIPPRRGGHSDFHRVLIIGAGDAGEHVARDMLRDDSIRIKPVGFLDDDPAKQGKRIHGVRVYGPISSLGEVAARERVDQVLIAMPSAPSRVVRELVRWVAEEGLKAKILPALGELMGEYPTTADIRDVDIGDLIARNPLKIDMKQIAAMVDGRCVLVTGAAGSIGSELARQLLHWSPRQLLLLDNNETDLYSLYQRLNQRARTRKADLRMVVGDIRDRRGIDSIFKRYRPDLVFHAAAYKHVPVMELHPEEAISTNVRGTRNVAEAALASNAERFVLVSTDKAVNPTSVMGASKRLAEMIVADLARSGRTIFSSVRFGNVVASRGSVVPLFAQQIRDGGPITVTHPDATRYFMTLEEAVSLICQAAALGKGGEIFVLEMGEPVRIMDLAERMRSLLANGRSEEIDIVVTGLRPGEKLHEELWNARETLLPVQPGIRKAKHPFSTPLDRAVHDEIRWLEQLASERADLDEIVKRLVEIASRHPEGTTVSDSLI